MASSPSESQPDHNPPAPRAVEANSDSFSAGRSMAHQAGHDLVDGAGQIMNENSGNSGHFKVYNNNAPRISQDPESRHSNVNYGLNVEGHGSGSFNFNGATMTPTSREPLMADPLIFPSLHTRRVLTPAERLPSAYQSRSAGLGFSNGGSAQTPYGVNPHSGNFNSGAPYTGRSDTGHLYSANPHGQGVPGTNGGNMNKTQSHPSTGLGSWNFSGPNKTQVQRNADVARHGQSLPTTGFGPSNFSPRGMTQEPHAPNALRHRQGNPAEFGGHPQAIQPNEVYDSKYASNNIAARRQGYSKGDIVPPSGRRNQSSQEWVPGQHQSAEGQRQIVPGANVTNSTRGTLVQQPYQLSMGNSGSQSLAGQASLNAGRANLETTLRQDGNNSQRRHAGKHARKVTDLTGDDVIDLTSDDEGPARKRVRFEDDEISNPSGAKRPTRPKTQQTAAARKKNQTSAKKGSVLKKPAAPPAIPPVFEAIDFCCGIFGNIITKDDASRDFIQDHPRLRSLLNAFFRTSKAVCQTKDEKYAKICESAKFFISVGAIEGKSTQPVPENESVPEEFPGFYGEHLKRSRQYYLWTGEGVQSMSKGIFLKMQRASSLEAIRSKLVRIEMGPGGDYQNWLKFRMGCKKHFKDYAMEFWCLQELAEQEIAAEVQAWASRSSADNMIAEVSKMTNAEQAVRGVNQNGHANEEYAVGPSDRSINPEAHQAPLFEQEHGDLAEKEQMHEPVAMERFDGGGNAQVPETALPDQVPEGLSGNEQVETPGGQHGGASYTYPSSAPVQGDIEDWSGVEIDGVYDDGPVFADDDLAVDNSTGHQIAGDIVQEAYGTPKLGGVMVGSEPPSDLAAMNGELPVEHGLQAEEEAHGPGSSGYGSRVGDVELNAHISLPEVDGGSASVFDPALRY